jgi:hypothetical protein
MDGMMMLMDGSGRAMTALDATHLNHHARIIRWLAVVASA